MVFAEKDSELLHQQGNKLSPCSTSMLFIGSIVSNNRFQPILKDTPFPRLFPSSRQERSQHAGYRGQNPGVCTILSLSKQLLRQLKPRHNGRKQQRSLQSAANMLLVRKMCTPAGNAQNVHPPSAQGAARALPVL